MDEILRDDPLKDLVGLIFCDLLVVFGSTEASNFDTENILTYQVIN